MNLTVIKNAGSAIKAFAFKSGLVKNAPKILLGIGITSMVGGTVVACKQTLKVEEILDDHQNSVEEIHSVRNEALEAEEDFYTEKDMKKDLCKTYIRTTGRIMKVYSVPVALIGGGIISVVSSHNILNTRYLTALAAYDALGKKFAEYRKRVIEDFGPEADELYRYGIEKHEEIVETTNKKGNVKKKLETTYKPRPEGLSEFAVIFGPDYSSNAIRPHDYAGDGYSRNTIQAIRNKNVEFLLNVQAQCNEKLRREGHLFLNDVYRMLGMLFPTNDGGYTSDRACGAINGWIWITDDEGNYIGPGDGYVDFGIFDFEDSHNKQAFVDGFEDNIWLDFNCDGIMYDLIGDFRTPKSSKGRKRIDRTA
ncbi:MAG: hypothetical protein J6Y02_13085 [Pseudobutyrivibrio sp.]|nr:hypothetical protein [Pseudobutyrivibrio sp.]